MTELRDARLRQALDHAPDAGLQPPAGTREAIRAAAHAAVQPAWRRWWSRAGTGGTPWAAAFATVVLATLVTVTWQGREVPGAREEVPVAMAPSAPAPAAAPPAVPAPAAAPPPVAAPRPAPAPARAPVASPAPAPDLPALRDAAPAADALAKAQRAEEGEARARAAPPPPPPSAPAAAMAPAPAPAPAPPAAPAAAPQRSAALRAAAGAVPWTQVRLEAAGRSVVVPRPQSGELPALVTSALASPSEPADPAATALLRLELAQGDDAVGALELVGERWRWTPLGQAGQARLLRADPALAAALREEAERLLRR